MINTYQLFAVTMIHGKFVVPLDLHKKILNFVEEKYIEKEREASCVKGCQIHNDFDGKKELDKELNIFLNNNLRLDIEHAWLNILGKDSYNVPHRHFGDLLDYTGVLYLSVENSPITFVKDDYIHEIKPQLFEYLIFPADLVHYVLPAEKNEKRISYSFNLKKIGGENVK